MAFFLETASKKCTKAYVHFFLHQRMPSFMYIFMHANERAEKTQKIDKYISFVLNNDMILKINDLMAAPAAVTSRANYEYNGM